MVRRAEVKRVVNEYFKGREKPSRKYQAWITLFYGVIVVFLGTYIGVNPPETAEAQAVQNAMMGWVEQGIEWVMTWSFPLIVLTLLILGREKGGRILLYGYATWAGVSALTVWAAAELHRFGDFLVPLAKAHPEWAIAAGVGLIALLPELALWFKYAVINTEAWIKEQWVKLKHLDDEPQQKAKLYVIHSSDDPKTQG